MKLSTKILALVFIVLAFWPVLVAIVLGHPYKASSEPPYVRGAMVWFFGVGGVGLLLQRSWGWWLAITGSLLLIVGIVMTITVGLDWITGLVGLFAVLASVALLADRPSRWTERKTKA